MGKKRKSIATSLDEVDRTMYASFCGAANSLSQLYTQAMNHQKLSFQAGERHSLEKLYQWICRQQEGGSRVATIDILNYLQNELDYCGEEPSMSPRVLAQNQHTQAPMHSTNSGFPVSSGSSVPTNAGQRVHTEHCDHQSKNSVFSNALSSPVRRSLQHYHISQERGYYPNSSLSSGNGPRNNEPNFLQPQNRDSNPPSSNDSSMDMHADSPAQDSNY
ncbi:uncharacterized protein LOC21406544 [Morus notabilis]|uniref:uncharacterized protein LOC21406544 n=1 Tax=Morus notabilis TaxID=981085 RepID=UPI000CED39E7|nr:uncharacterized protein LOC21406544 [Morus notabilis]